MANYRFFIDYLTHYVSAKNRHGVHSPFVYQLIDEVIYNFSKKPYEKAIEDKRLALKRNTERITITDMGAGSMLNNGKQKQIKTIANNALKPKRVSKLLARLAERFSPRTIIELGTCLGITTSYLSKASPDSFITTVEGCPETAKVAKQTLQDLGSKNVELVIGNFDYVLPGIVQRVDKIDFLFVDGNHRKEATLNYFNYCLPKTHSQTVLIFDDIYWSKGMKEAWQTIKSHPKVTLTIDLFYIGLVFFREGRETEHFKVRF
ncbi:class I SAM-dependent methyltransferase [Olivibacter sp. SDN3]|uniref:O-methyltransferase n=1 Tax=Olivibacter sp. SDN3 TaxID=2764720 RepID=UPI0016517E3B|nr:class I SAM-dependent methyltransferase [Olivibacter sp. SDN3]QNL51322.1 class I SAM-dependent methyltransferase [Olivibacter sp. SDN3]